MKATSKILFISANSHQKQTFLYVASNLPPEFTGKVVRIKSFLNFPVTLWMRALPALWRRHSGEPIAGMMEFTYKKRVARFGWFKGLIRIYLHGRSKLLYRLFYALLKDESPDLVVVWGGLALPVSAAVAAAKDLGCKLLYCENGYLPKTIVMDPVGVNAKNSLVGKDRSFYEQIAVDAEKMTALFQQALIQRPLKKADSALEDRIKASESEVRLPDDYIFLPLQVHDDSQVLLYSPRFKNMPDMIRYCHDQIGDYNQRYQTKLKLVVKEHPSDFGRIDYTAVKKELEGDVHFIQALGTPELLQGCRAVITINSTVGIEGLFCFKPVITLGDAFYNVPGLLYHLDEGLELSDLLETALTTPVDVELVEKFLYYLKYRYLVAFDRRAIETVDPAAVIARIRATLDSDQLVF